METENDISALLLSLRFSPNYAQNRKTLCETLLRSGHQALAQYRILVDRHRLTEAQSVISELTESGLTALSILDSRYPQRLRQISDPPLVLFIKGELPKMLQHDDGFVVAIVGSRTASPYGLRVTDQLAKDVVRRRGIVVSGLAYGIDSTAHQAAAQVAESILAVSPTSDVSAGVAVLGSGLLSIYPRSNLGLCSKIIGARGAILSEYLPHERPTRYNFPERNRIVSGLADAVVVVEAAERSGALITASLAAEQGREVFAVPGPIDSPMSCGTNELLRQGAAMLRNVDDLIEGMPRLAHALASSHEVATEQHNVANANQESQERAISGLTAAEQSLARKLLPLFQRHDRLAFEALMAQTSADSSELRSVLTRLEISGAVYLHPGDLYSRHKFV